MMFKPIYNISLSVVLLAVLTDCLSVAKNGEGLFGYEEQQFLEARNNGYDKRLLQASEAFIPYAYYKRGSSGFTRKQRAFQQEMLDAHNRYRKRHCVPPLRLDDDLSLSAQKYAEKLASTKTFKHSKTPGVGENLYWRFSIPPFTSASGIAEAATTSWYDESKRYNYNGDYQHGTGHFTQVVWKSTKTLGVGYAFANGNREIYVVAQYKPPGNYIGQFQANVLRPRC